jgi:hypothetical protein
VRTSTLAEVPGSRPIFFRRSRDLPVAPAAARRQVPDPVYSLQSMKGDAVAHCLTATSAAAVPTPTVALPPAVRGQNNSQLCALPPTDAGLQLALEPSPMEQLAAPIRASNGQSKISYTDQEVQLMLGL